MKNNATKEKLMEMLVKLNPESAKLNEVTASATPVNGTQAPTQVPTTGTPVGATAPAATAPAATAAPVEKPITGDPKTYQKQLGMSYGVKSASSRINTATEFPQAFKLWFASLGYDPQNQAISTSKVLTDIRKAMAEMGYK
jgi:hypothetical protein